MYTSFFGLHEKPFAITPDPRYLYLSERHAEALAHLLYGITEAGGFIQLTGEVGTGKTTVVRTLLSRIPENADVAVIMNPRITPAEFLMTICEELGLAVPNVYRDSVKELVDALNHRLLSAHAEGRRVVLIVDEAQNLSSEVLEQLRLLTNLETATQKLLQIILIGQPELRTLLGRNDLRQLAQRITGRYHLNPLTRGETAGYVQHRLRVAGAGTNFETFTKNSLAEVHRLAAGIPRVINVICDRASDRAARAASGRRGLRPALCAAMDWLGQRCHSVRGSRQPGGRRLARLVIAFARSKCADTGARRGVADTHGGRAAASSGSCRAIGGRDIGGPCERNEQSCGLSALIIAVGHELEFRR
jgi:type II secretory pathway predicted ATPase ExeA